jgi:hypothetical protein
MNRYNLVMMLEEIQRDERGGKPVAKKVLTQQEIKALAKARRAAGARKPPDK